MNKQNHKTSVPSSEENQKSNTELLNEVNSILSNSSIIDVDMDTVKRNLAILDERNPIELTDDREETWQAIMANHRAYLASKQTTEPENTADRVTVREKRPRRKLLVAVYAVVGVLLTLIVGSYAAGVDPFQSVAKWTGDRLFVATNPSGELELPKNTVSEYRSLREALDQNGAEDAMCPSWVPKDYAIDSIDFACTQRISKYTAVFYSERGELGIVVLTGYSTTTNSVETELSGYREYMVNGDIYYLSENTDYLQAYGEIGSYRYSVVGNLKEEELEAIIQSLYR